MALINSIVGAKGQRWTRDGFVTSHHVRVRCCALVVCPQAMHKSRRKGLFMGRQSEDLVAAREMPREVGAQEHTNDYPLEEGGPTIAE